LTEYVIEAGLPSSAEFAALPLIRMILYADSGGGRFGNQLLRFFHWTAWARELGQPFTVLDLPFWPYTHLFAEWSQRPGCVYPHSRVGSAADLAGHVQSLLPIRWREHWTVKYVIARLARKLGALGIDVVDLPAETKLNLEEPAFVERARRSRFLVCAGWEFACWNWLERHEAEVRRLFAPAPAPLAAATAFLRELRERHDIVIGMHIRRGDYREFFEGRLYYSWTSYVRWAREAVEMFPSQRVAILVTGDDLIPSELFAGLPVIWASGSINRGGHWFASFLELSLCDFIIGAPSTFAACAAFLGNCPWLPLREADQVLKEKQMMHRHLFEAARDPLLALSIR
jgi:hypothetical protein